MVELGNAVFWIFNIFFGGMFLFSLALGWRQGGKRMGLGILRAVIQIIATFTLTSFLTKRYSWFDSQNF